VPSALPKIAVENGGPNLKQKMGVADAGAPSLGA